MPCSLLGLGRCGFEKFVFRSLPQVVPDGMEFVFAVREAAPTESLSEEAIKGKRGAHGRKAGAGGLS